MALLLRSLRHLAFVFLLHDFDDVGQQRGQQFIGGLDVLVDILDGCIQSSTSGRHMLKLLLADATELPADESLTHNIMRRFITRILHVLIESVALKETSDKALHLDDDAAQESHLAARKRLVVVVLLPANGAGLRLTTILGYSLEGLEACLVEDVRAAQNFLLLHLEILEANRARMLFLVLCPFQELHLNLLPLGETERQVGFISQAQLLR